MSEAMGVDEKNSVRPFGGHGRCRMIIWDINGFQSVEEAYELIGGVEREFLAVDHFELVAVDVA